MISYLCIDFKPIQRLEKICIMEFNEIQSSTKNLITAYDTDYLSIHDKKITENVLIYPETISLILDITTIHDINELTIQKAINFNPEIILFGFNSPNLFLSANQIKIFHDHNIAVESMNLMSACRTFNILLSEQRKVIFFAFLNL